MSLNTFGKLVHGKNSHIWTASHSMDDNGFGGIQSGLASSVTIAHVVTFLVAVIAFSALHEFVV